MRPGYIRGWFDCDLRLKPSLFLYAALLPVCLESAVDREAVDFAHEIVPILKEHCIECHGGEESKGGFSINTRRLFLEG